MPPAPDAIRIPQAAHRSERATRLEAVSRAGNACAAHGSGNFDITDPSTARSPIPDRHATLDADPAWLYSRYETPATAAPLPPQAPTPAACHCHPRRASRGTERHIDCLPAARVRRETDVRRFHSRTRQLRSNLRVPPETRGRNERTHRTAN
jgi:hypothetical protein